ncbi:type I-E CRISPR-associated protein Cse2/CasB [Thiolapillus sp.]
MKFRILKKNDEPKAVADWHGWIHHENQRGERARLRRCESLDEVLMQPAFFRLARVLPRLEPRGLTGLALVAGLLVWAEKTTETDLPVMLGKPKAKDSDTRLFSELRFQRLLASRDAEDFFQSMRRAIVQAGKQADPVALADAILHWEEQQRRPELHRGNRQWQYRMAKPYYTGQS